MTLEKYAEMIEFASSVGNFQDRVTSKDAAFSTLITVAPSSAKKVPTEGPARTVDASTTSNFENIKKYYCLAPFRT